MAVFVSYRILSQVSIQNTRRTSRGYRAQKDQITIEEINIQSDHIHMMLSIPPKYSVSEIMGFLKGKTAIKLFQEQKSLTKTYWASTSGHADTVYPP